MHDQATPRLTTPPLSVARPESLFVLSALSQYIGASIAISMFERVAPATVAWLRVCTAAAILVTLSWSSVRRPWTRREAVTVSMLGIITAAMNMFFYLGIDRLPLGSSVSIEFIGQITVAAILTRTWRNAIALGTAATGVFVLSGLNIEAEPLGLVFILLASSLWAGYIVVGSSVARNERGVAGLAVGLTVGALVTSPIGVLGISPVLGSAYLLVLCASVGLFSNAIAYGLDQVVMRTMPARRFALMSALLPVTALAVGVVALGERPTVLELCGTALVVCGVVIQERHR